MKKRVCETCRYFEEAGFAKNGWCNHPQRKPTSDVMIIVRRGELACRNGWSQDLWTPKTEADGDTDVVLHQPVVAPRPLPPASAEEIASVVNAQRPPQANELQSPPVDVVVGEAPAAQPAESRQPLLHQDPRSAILKAREQYRERLRAQARQSGADPAPGPLSSRHDGASSPSSATATSQSGAVSAHDARLANSAALDGSGVVPPVRLNELPRPFPTMTTFPEDELRFSTVPAPADGVDLPRRPVQERAKVIRAPEVSEDDMEAATARSVQAAVSREQPAHEGSRVMAEKARSLPLAPPLWRQARRNGPGHRANEAPRLEPQDQPHQEAMHRAMANRGQEAMLDLPLDEEPRTTEVPVNNLEVASYAYGEVGEREPQDLLPWVAPELPRVCRTCRDFRPTEGGERGWCTNPWAFHHRRMVDADELPCLTSIGCWWLPHDDIWLEKADVSAHGQPTPLVDQWLGSRSGTSASEAAAGQRRRGRQ